MVEATGHLTKHIRLVIYNFLDVGTVLKKISYLSRQERENLRKSAIAREHKHALFKLQDLLGEACFMHGSEYDRVMAKVAFGLSLCEIAELVVNRDAIAFCSEHTSDEALAFFISSLPRRLEVSMQFAQAKSKINLKTFWLTARARRPDFALRKMVIRGC